MVKLVAEWRERRRRRTFESQLVAGLTFVNNALRAGLGLAQAVALVGEETDGAFAQEMTRIHARVQLGLALTDALQESAAQTPVADWQLTVQSCLILMETGGNMIESFQLILDTIRERQRVSEKIRTATVSGRVQAMIIAAMPFGIAGMLAVLSPDYIAPLFSSSSGLGICAMGALMLACGVVWMRAILDVEV